LLSHHSYYSSPIKQIISFFLIIFSEKVHTMEENREDASEEKEGYQLQNETRQEYLHDKARVRLS
jgi:hypothetical protein